MAIVLITTAPSRDLYEQITAEIGTETPRGCIVHTASDVDGGVRIVEVWESQADLDDFFQGKLGPAFAKFGVEPQAPPERMETFNLLRS